MNKVTPLHKCTGFSLMEVLVTMIIILVGLLGIVALQGKAQVAELEAYQRAQALIIMSDIVDRIYANRATATCFQITTDTTVGTPYIGIGSSYASSCTASTSAYNTQADTAIDDLDNLLKGAAEELGGSEVGAMIGARACISYDSTSELTGQPGTGLYNIIVTWQGLGDLIAPTGMNCAVNLYGTEAKRRAVATSIRIANLF